mmetsp:Transcript_2587/g.5961  ORF Transcript_2587/g.5961 Transcript_2587/m.5961 type:complete len:239 (+) Transcript_2587:1-717(+)
MSSKIIVWDLAREFFFVNSLKDILILRNNFRIQGLMIQKQFFDNEHCFFLILNWEETLMGLEGGFLKIKHIQPFFSPYLQKSIFRFFTKNKYFERPFVNFLFKKRNQIFIRRWRENKSLFFKTLLSPKKSRKKNKSENQFSILMKNFFKPNSSSCLSLKTKTFLKYLKLKDYNRFFIYRDLWGRGFTISCGLKFGASFLVYANNVGLVHSFLSIFISPYPFFFLFRKFSFIWEVRYNN